MLIDVNKANKANMQIHKSDSYYQQGGASGIGSIFSSIFKGLIPLAKGAVKLGQRAISSNTGKKVIKAAKRSAVDAGLDIAHDVLKGENVGQTVTKRMNRIGNDLEQNIFNEFQTKKKLKKKPKSRVPKKKKKAFKKGAGRGKKSKKVRSKTSKTKKSRNKTKKSKNTKSKKPKRAVGQKKQKKKQQKKQKKQGGRKSPKSINLLKSINFERGNLESLWG